MPLAPHDPAAAAAEHADLIVALDAGDLAASDRSRAETLATGCAGCASLLADLAAIRHAVAELPAPARRRDYRLTPEDAARLQPSGWRRVVGWLAAPRSSVRPLATGLATLGVVGLLLTSGLPGFAGGAATLSTVGAPVTDRAGAAQELAPTEGSEPFRASAVPGEAPTSAPAPSAAPAVAAPRATEIPAGVAGADASTAPSGEQNAMTGDLEAGKGALAADGTDAALPVPALASFGLLVAGIGLFVARAIARRRLA